MRGRITHRNLWFSICNQVVLIESVFRWGSGVVDRKDRIMGIVLTMVFAVSATAQSGTLVLLPPIY